MLDSGSLTRINTFVWSALFFIIDNHELHVYIRSCFAKGEIYPVTQKKHLIFALCDGVGSIFA